MIEILNKTAGCLEGYIFSILFCVYKDNKLSRISAPLEKNSKTIVIANETEDPRNS